MDMDVQDMDDQRPGNGRNQIVDTTTAIGQLGWLRDEYDVQIENSEEGWQNLERWGEKGSWLQMCQCLIYIFLRHPYRCVS